MSPADPSHLHREEAERQAGHEPTPDPGMVPFDDLPEETRKNLKPGQPIAWDKTRGIWIPSPTWAGLKPDEGGGRPMTMGEIAADEEADDVIARPTMGVMREIVQRQQRLEQAVSEILTPITIDEESLRRKLEERVFCSLVQGLGLCLVESGSSGTGRLWRNEKLGHIWRLAAEAVEDRP